MATVRSLGLHEPSALSYLVAESALPETACEDDFAWTTFSGEDSDGTPTEEEILFTGSRVVWSRGGVVKRSFAFDVEKEKVVDALFARFPATRKSTEGAKGPENASRSSDTPATATATAPGQGQGKPQVQQPKGKKGKQVTIRTDSDIEGIPGISQHDNGNEEAVSRALVVVLRTQVHIFFLHADSHVVPLPFEVDSVWAAPKGLLFQRKVSDESHSSLPSAPPNSFASSHPGIRTSGSFRLSGGSAPRQSSSAFQSQQQKWPLKQTRDDSLPRVFSLVDPQSEMGLVVTSRSAHDPRSEATMDLMDPAEEILYVSSSDELPQHQKTCGLIFVVTLNEKSGMYTVWTARYRDKSSVLPRRKRRKSSSATFSKRRSSHFDMATSASTPASRGPSGVRESFGGLHQSRNASTLSQTLNNPISNPEAMGTSAGKTDDLATQLGPEFGDTWKTSRRVSSLLARTDLAANYDRSTFSDLAAGNQPTSSMYAGGRRGESLGGHSNRGSFGLSQRSSLPGGNNPTFNNSASFLDAPADKFLEGLSTAGDFEGFERMGLTETVSGLPREVILTKVASLTSGFPTTTRGTLASNKDQKFEVFTLPCSHDSTTSDGEESSSMAVCVLNKNSKILTVITLHAQRTNASKQQRKHATRKAKHRTAADDDSNYSVRATDTKNISNVVDCRKIVDSDSCRMLVLSAASNGCGELTLQTPGAHPVKVELPCNMCIHQPYDVSLARAPGLSHEAGLKRVVTSSGLRLRALGHVSNNGKVTVVDHEDKKHRIQIQLEPRNSLVKQALETCKFVLQRSGKAGGGIHVAWAEAMKWLRTRDDEDDDELEWTALVVTLFSMAVDFVEDSPPQKTTQKKKRSGLLRYSSSSSTDMSDWESMLDQEAGSSGVASPWMASPAWGWISEQDATSTSEETEASRSKESRTSSEQPRGRENTYIVRCAALARDFLSSPTGAAASGPEGSLPTSAARDHHDRRKTSLGTIVVGLHLLREELKLSTVAADVPSSRLGLLAPVLAQIGTWLGWQSWTAKPDGYYGAETASIDRWAFEDSRITKLDIPSEPFAPPSIFAFLESSLQRKQASFPSIVKIASSSEAKPGKGRLWKQGLNLTPRTLAIVGFISEIGRQRTVGEKVALLLRWGLTSSVIDTLPDGISASFHEAIVRCQIDPPTPCSPSLLELVDRDDLFMSMNSDRAAPSSSWPHVVPPHDAVRDTHQIKAVAVDGNQTHAIEMYSPEADRYSVTSMIFHEDRRFIEAMRLLNQMKAPAAECFPEPDWSESDLLEAQKEVVQLVIMRTLSIPIGRAMASFRARMPLLTDKLPIPSFSLQCVMKPSNVTISADRSSFTEERVSWAFFHNGVSAGLAISKHARGIDTSWILYNKPAELTNRHSGFLLALGLNGHLKSLAKWVAFKYLIPKHTMTSIGLLLGLSASYLGTMDTLITRLLSVHITRMLPPGAAELNLSPLTQTTGIMGIGLVYCGSQHRRMTEVMLSEIETLEEDDTSIPQEPLRDEGYRLAAGFALGLINLAKGRELRGLRDMRIVERLLALAVGTKNVDVVHVLDRTTAGATVALATIFMKSNDASIAEKIDIPDTAVQFDYVRPDIFLLRTLAKHLIMWDSIQPNGEWIQKNVPKFYRRRCRLTSTHHLSTDDMPLFNVIAGLCFAVGLRFAGSRSLQARNLLVLYLDQFVRICRLPVVNYDGKLARNSVRNCQDIVALSASAVMAGTGDLAVFRRLRSLHGRVDADVPYGSYMAAHMAVGILFLGGGTYTLGTSDLAVASLLCSFYPVFPATVLDNKCHLQAFRHLWVLAVEPRCLIPRDLDTRRAVTVPVRVALKSGQKQDITAPCLLPDLTDIASVTVQSPDHWGFTLNFSNNDGLHAKFLDGDQSIYVRKRTSYNNFGSSAFSSTLMALSDMQDIPASSSFSLSYFNSRAVMNSGPSATPGTAATTAPPMQPTTTRSPLTKLFSSQGRYPNRPVFEWVFDLPAFRHLNMGEKTLVVSPAAMQPRFVRLVEHHHLQQQQQQQQHGHVGLPAWLRPTVVDTRLVLEKTVSNFVAAAAGRGIGDDAVRDRLWQLRLLFAWADRVDEEDRGEEGSLADRSESAAAAAAAASGGGGGGGMWLPTEAIQDARWKIWAVQVGDLPATMMGQNEQQQPQSQRRQEEDAVA